MTARSLSLATVALAALLGTPAMAQPAPDALIDAFEGVVGPIRTHRPSHARGLCAVGHFTATPEGTRLSVAPVFNGQRVPTIIRFGVAGSTPAATDNSRGTRGLSIRFETAAGDTWDMANISVPIFGSPTPDAFLAGLLARRPDPVTRQTDAAAIQSAKLADQLEKER